MNLLRINSNLDVLPYYSIIAKKLKRYLKGKEVATKIWLPKGNFPFILKRGSQIDPLHIEYFDALDKEFLKLRKEDFEKVESKLTKKQRVIWQYFVPRKLCDFFYATNNEGVGKPIERIFFDIDRSNFSAEQAQKVAKELINVIINDKDFNKLIKFKPFVLWTGNSFHILLFLDKKINNAFYEAKIQYSKKDPLVSFIGRWALEVSKKVGFNVIGGHERIKDKMNIDPSQTPSGKLARAPFSLHMKDALTVDGIALPVLIKELDDAKLIDRLKSYNPEKVVKELNSLARKLPKKFQ
ncbi:hypothetical protein HYX19_01145 [Candidatus Woesearchaeota archaeon]|nr:hypothetical protein [Candidatus Woesearchaeota archaeon]